MAKRIPKVSDDEWENNSSKVTNESVSVEKIAVYVCGAVKNEGVYEVSPEARISDALAAAGGLCQPILLYFC